MQLWVGLLGPFEVRWAGERVALAGAKLRALLAMLALRANEPISVDELVERVWSSSSPRRPTKTVQVHVTRLRAALGEAASRVVTTPTGYVLRVDEEQVDLTRFERLLGAGRAALTDGDAQGAGAELAAALALWRGPALADFAHEEFAQEEIRRLQELRLSALEARLEADLQLGRHGAVVAELDALVREHPLRERLHGQRMLALYRCGRQAEALDAFQRARRVLVEQIGVEPGPELRQLHEAILHHDASLAYRPGAPELPSELDDERIQLDEARSKPTPATFARDAPTPDDPALDAPPGTGSRTTDDRDARRASRRALGDRTLPAPPNRTIGREHDLVSERLLTGEPGRVEPADRTPSHSSESAGAGRATVPAPPSPLLGRDHDLDGLRALLDAKDVRLVTVVGPGGVGKTRLAVELARELVGTGSEVAWVALAPIRTARDVAVTIARALGVTPGRDESAEEALARAVVAQELVLVLDNFEHVAPAAGLVADLLAAAQGLTVLVTSREPLRVRAERVFRLSPLEVPPGDVGADELTASPATALFLATSVAREPDLELTGEDASAVAEICRRVDGLPLAIELAAGRLGVLSPQELAAQVRGGLDPLALAARDAPDRHRSLRDTLAWSHRLLTEEEQTAFARFAVFAGGADPRAAHAVTGAELGVLQALADKHLVAVTADRDGGRRLDMLETVRRFALQQLEREDDVEQLAARHADYFLELAEGAAPDLRRRGPSELFRRLDRELHNLRAAMTWALEHDRPERCLRLAVALEQYWGMYGPDEGVRWLQAGLEAARPRLPTELLARALTALSGQLGILGAGREAEALARQALAAAPAEDPAVRLDALLELTYTLLIQYRIDEARAVAHEAVALGSVTGDPALMADARLMEASCAPSVSSAIPPAEAAAAHFERVGHASRLLDLYGALVEVALAHGDDAAASNFLERAKDAALCVPAERERTWVLGSEGCLRLVTGDLVGARQAFGSELALAERLSVDENLPEALYGLAAISAVDGSPDVAARLRGAAEALAPEPLPPALGVRIEQQCFEAGRRRVGEARWGTEVALGRQLGLAEALRLARAAIIDLSSAQGGQAGVR